jgi:hypothetical protein
MVPIRTYPYIAAILGLILTAETKGLYAQQEHLTLTFNRDRVHVGRVMQYDVVGYGEFSFTQQVGAPQLPEGIVHLALPPGKEIAAIVVKSLESEPLHGEYDLFPAQPPQILSRRNVQFVPRDESRFLSSAPYPESIVEIAPQGYLAGYNVGALIVHPVQYVASTRMLILHTRIELEVSYGERDGAARAFRTTGYTTAILENAVRGLVVNPERITRAALTNPQSLLPPGEHLYVIITGENLVSTFQPLADWKCKKGLSATIVTTSWIYANYSGIDAQEKIRNFIVAAYQSWGTAWVLLGGDINVIPDRKAYAFDCEYGPPSDNFIPCDLYYSDLDRNWNADGDTTYGEVADSIDMYPDVFVGRAPVENQAEANAFVNKVLTYENSPPNGHEARALFLAEVLWNNPYTNSGVSKDHIDSLYVPAQFDPVTKLYEALGNENPTTVVNAINLGQNLINHDGHASQSVMGVGTGYLTISHMDGLTNGPMYSTLFSIGCWPAAFDYNCIAEHFVTNPNGGGVAFIGNSRYGWGSPGNPLYGYSDRFDQQFFKRLFVHNHYQAGSALAAAKAVYVPFSRQGNVYRWCQYELNLLGDPEMPIWTDTPRAMSVTKADHLPLGSSVCQVTVTDGIVPVAGALVCLMQDSTVYRTGMTGHNGQVALDVTTTNPANPIQLTVTACNFIPYEGTVSLVASGPFVQIPSCVMNGSALGYVRPGDLVSVGACFRNYGNEPAQNVVATIRSNSTQITIIDSTESAGNILSGDSVHLSNAFTFLANTNLQNAAVVQIECEISDVQAHVWNDLIAVTGATPIVSYYCHRITDTTYGDGDGFAEPGETVELGLVVENQGLDTARNVLVTTNTGCPYLSIVPSSIGLGTIPPGIRTQGSTAIQVNAVCPTPLFPDINVLFQTQDGYQFTDTMFLSVGEFGFRDDMESGPGSWTHSGTIDLWHLTGHRKHSGNYSWYCGEEGTFHYQSNMNNFLESAPVVIDRNPELSFWCWYELPNYGTDGLYVEAGDSSGWHTLDFVGSGGALGTLTTGNDWLEYTYDLSQYPIGSSLRLRFRFASDNSVTAEGVYIDDVKIHERKPDIIVGVPSVEPDALVAYQLLQNYPNPFNPTTTIRYAVPVRSHVRIEVFNILGQMIDVLVDEALNAGVHEAVWEARAASGVYFYRIEAVATDNTALTYRKVGRMLLLR